MASSAQVNALGKGGYLVSGIEEPLEFARELALLAGESDFSVPRFSREGEPDPGGMTPMQEELLLVLYGHAINMLDERPAPPGPGLPDVPNPFDYEFSVFPTYGTYAGLLDGGLGDQPLPAPGGKWMKQCLATEPCVRPTAPDPPEIDDCSDLLRDINVLQAWLDAWEAEVLKRQAQLDGLEVLDSGLHYTGWAMGAMTVAAILSAPASLPVTLAFIASSTSLTLLLVDIAGDVAQDLLIDDVMGRVQRDLANAKKERDDAQDRLDRANDLYNECIAAQAAAQENPSPAFLDYINNLLPAYFDCLKKQNTCLWVWVPD